MKRKILIDTDPGVDDAMALMLAIKSEQFDLQAITTVCGNATIENVTRNARFVLEVLGRSDLPLYSGAAHPLVKSLQISVVHGASGLGKIEPAAEPSLTANAVEKILALVEASDGEITLVALGPLTNIAQAIQQNPQVMSRVREIVMMGGAIKAPGNVSPVAEFNFYVDPDAAEIVFRAPIPRVMVPLDACNKVCFSLDDYAAVSDARLRKILVEMAEPYIRSIAKADGEQAAPVYDALTIFYLIRPELCDTYRCHVAIETAGRLTSGMSVADLRPKPEGKPNTTVVDSVDEEAFRHFFVETLSRTN